MIIRFVFTLSLGILIGWFVNGYWYNATTVIVAKTQKPTITPKQSTVALKQPAVVVKKVLAEAPQVSAPMPHPQSINVSDAYAPKVLIERSKVAIDKGDYITALTHLEDLLVQVQDLYPRAFVETLYVNTSKQYIQKLGDNQPQQTIDFLNSAINVLPNYLEFHYLLAQLFLTLEQYSQVQYQLSFLANNIKWKVQFDRLQAQLDYIKTFQQGDIEIPLIALPNAWHINVMIDNTPAQLVLDTGASITTLSAHLVADSYQSLGDIILSTANGTLSAFKVNIDTFSVGAITKQNFPVVVLPKEKLPQDVDGLLGLDWLQDFNFIIDKKNALLRLTPISY
ncbi:hypothetical protein THERMOT_1654 [Bathymodiolus thermophilus thioautotrophic gill symbiont]|uniref:Peptidase A2 domain-containing protein n=1 Tax=Bathymodiolus thermophilus thioautotrophic gill symbiont TaxID=2360 RepID=A0A8H8XCW2_9GAMM|nr:retroviral-like aspartic protease family protein [Bathymodiolus thermophilus thioautotrophic gill symbiont]CAB5500877.1 hypothetical protein THERMOS_1283 [Bathymodiolus thermophilus thioautotrophic gill symbiont]CAB5502647.1 hypothetical protein THERMOT_1654 [Bathymodiolus thermophilus thioautotrophic gill symbiont]